MNIKNGIIMNEKLGDVVIKREIVPVITNKHRPMIKRVPKSITIHNTGNSNRNANAKAHSNYLKNLEKNPIKSRVSWNFVVDKDMVIQNIPIDEIAYCQGHSRGNRESISIEICDCYKKGSKDYDKAERNAIVLAGNLVRYYGFNKNEIFKHQDWTGKYCPNRILSEGRWREVQDRIYELGMKSENNGRELMIIVYGNQDDEIKSAYDLGAKLSCPIVPAKWLMDFKAYKNIGIKIVAIGKSVKHTSYKDYFIKDPKKVDDFIKNRKKYKV